MILDVLKKSSSDTYTKGKVPYDVWSDERPNPPNKYIILSNNVSIVTEVDIEQKHCICYFPDLDVTECLLRMKKILK